MGFLGGLIKKVGGVVKGVATKVIPGGSLVAAGAGLGGKLLKRVDRKVLKGAAIAGGGAVAGAGLMGLAGGGGERRRYRRMNPGNTRAMRRAVRRVEAGAKMYSRLFHMRHGSIKGAPKVHIKGHRRAA
jgi:hypothetical protein